MQILSKPGEVWENHLHYNRHHRHMQNELQMQKFKPSLCNITCWTCKIQYVEQTKITILEHFQGHYGNINKALRNPDHRPGTLANAHTTQLEGDTIGLHFAQSNHKCTIDLQIQVLKFISLPQNSERVLELHLRKEKF